MNTSNALRAAFAILMFVLGSLQAWESNVHDAGLLIVLLVSLAIALPPVTLLLPLDQKYSVGAVGVSILLLVLARAVSPVPLPGLLVALVPAGMGLIFGNVIRREGWASS